MKLITEVIENVKVIEEAVEGKPKKLFIEGIFLQSDVVNRNGRKYSPQIMEREVSRYIKEKIDTGRAYGELGHPNGPGINLDRVSHIITELRKDGNNFIGRAKVSTTPMGSIVRGLLEDGANLGVSSRGMGSLKTTKEGYQEVQDDFYLATAADIVADPSAPDAFVNGVMEGVEWCWEPGGKLIAKEVEEIEEEIEKSVRAREFNESKAMKIFEKYLEKVSKNYLV